MKTEKQPFEDVSPIRDGVFPSCQFIVLEAICSAIQVGFTKEFGRDSAICSQWIFEVPVKGGRWHIIPQLAGKMPLIYCLLGGYIIPTTFYGNQKQPLM